MEEKTFTRERLERVLSATPEVRPEVRKAFELLFGATVGHRIGKYSVRYGLTPVFQALGEATASPAIKDNASLIGHTISGGVSATGVWLLKGKWKRAIAWGGLFESVEAFLDYVEALVLVTR